MSEELWHFAGISETDFSPGFHLEPNGPRAKRVTIVLHAAGPLDLSEKATILADLLAKADASLAASAAGAEVRQLEEKIKPLQSKLDGIQQRRADVEQRRKSPDLLNAPDLGKALLALDQEAEVIKLHETEATRAVGHLRPLLDQARTKMRLGSAEAYEAAALEMARPLLAERQALLLELLQAIEPPLKKLLALEPKYAALLGAESVGGATLLRTEHRKQSELLGEVERLRASQPAQ